MKSTKTASRFFSLLLCLLLLASFAAPSLAADVSASTSASGSSQAETTPLTGYGTVLSDSYVYQDANTSSKKIVMLSKNIQVTYLGETGSFIKITYTNPSGKSYTGFMEKSKLKATDEKVSAGTASPLQFTVKPNSSSPRAAIASVIADAKGKNPDVVGYISIAGTNIQQPILYGGKDVHYYTNHNLSKKKDSAGMAYTFYNNLYRNNTLTAHNMRASNRLFHQLHHIQEKSLGYTVCQHSKCTAPDLSNAPDLNIAANRVWEISLLGYTKWEVYAMYEVKKDEPKSTINNNISPLIGYSGAQVQKWIDGQISRSEIKFNTKVSSQDALLTIYTCGTEYDSSTAQSRLYYFLKAVA